MAVHRGVDDATPTSTTRLPIDGLSISVQALQPSHSRGSDIENVGQLSGRQTFALPSLDDAATEVITDDGHATTRSETDRRVNPIDRLNCGVL
jgi:hypothetical protein